MKIYFCFILVLFSSQLLANEILGFETYFINGILEQNSDQCLPRNWFNLIEENVAKSSKSEKLLMNTSTESFNQVLKFLESGIKNVCYIKNYFTNFKREVGNKLLTEAKSYMSDAIVKADEYYNSLLYETGIIDTSNKKRKILTDLKHLTNSASSLLKGQMNQIIESAQNIFYFLISNIENVYNHVKKHASHALSKIIDSTENYVEGLINFIDDNTSLEVKRNFMIIKGFITDILDFYKSPMIQGIFKNIKKLKGNLFRIGNLMEKFKKIAIKLSQGGNPAELISNLICNYSKFVPAIQSFMKGMESDGSDKWTHLGTSIGIILNAIDI